MRNLLFVAFGGGLGAVARYGVGLAAARLLGKAFPWGTLVVNVVGCLLMGVVGQLLLDWRAELFAADAVLGESKSIDTLRHLAAIGFLGGLTTFSALGWDTFEALDNGRLTAAAVNVVANFTLGIFAIWLGATIVRNL